MNGKIYKYFNRKKYEETGEKSYYIGQTIESIEKRAGKNGYRYLKNTNSKFANAINKWGWDAFECEILEENIQTREALNEAEIKYIAEYDSYNNGYNTTAGGEGSSGYHITEERKQKMLDGKRRKVYCNELDMLFNSLTDAKNYIGIKSTDGISGACNGKYKYSGTAIINGKKTNLTWKYIDSEDEMLLLQNSNNNDDVIKINKPIVYKKVYCPELDMTFDSIKEATTYIGLKSTDGISGTCSGRYNYAGSYIINGVKTKLTWKYIDLD